MNILFLTTHLNTGGITSYILTLGESLVKSGHQVNVASSGGNCEALFETAGIKHIKINIRTKSEIHPKLWLQLPMLNDLVRREKIDIIHAQTRVTQVLGTVLSRLSGIPLITTCHGFFRPHWFRKAFSCWGRGVIAISKPVKDHLKNDFAVPDNKIHLIFNGLDLNRFKSASEQTHQMAKEQLGFSDKPLIGIIARLSDVKGVDTLIKAMPLVLKEIPSAHLLIVGQGPHESALKQLVQDLSLVNKIHFKNSLNRPQDILPAFDVFVMPSLMEGLGLSVMEAQACGIPVVASKVGGLIDLIEDGISGLLVPSGDQEMLSQRIIEVLSNPERSMTLAAQARLNIEQNFSAEIMTQKTLKIYEQYSCCQC